MNLDGSERGTEERDSVGLVLFVHGLLTDSDHTQ